MAILIGTNLKYEGPDFLDGRKSVKFQSDLGNLDIDLFPDGYEIFCNYDKSWYILNKEGTKDNTTGYFVKRSDAVYDNSKAEQKDKAIISDFKTFINNAFPWVPKYSDKDNAFASDFPDIYELGSDINVDISSSFYRAGTYYYKNGSIGGVIEEPNNFTISYRLTDLNGNGQDGGNWETIGNLDAVENYIEAPIISHNFGSFTIPTIIEIKYGYTGVSSNGGTGKDFYKTIITDFHSSAGFINKANIDWSKIYNKDDTKFEKTKNTRFSKGYAEFNISATEKGLYPFVILRPGVIDPLTTKNNLRVFINNQLTTCYEVNKESINNGKVSSEFCTLLFDYPINTTSSINVKIEKI